MYIPQSQVPDGLTQLANSVIPLSWCIRSAAGQTMLAAAVQREIQAVDGQMPVSHVRTMEEVIAGEVSRQTFNMTLLSIFAAIALLLAAIGIYGLMSYAVAQQTQELGIRMALGADRRDLLRLILKQGMKPAGAGVIAGLVMALAATRLLSSLLFGVKTYDLFTFGTVAVLLLFVALFSTYLPARRAMQVDPAVALRNE